MIEEEARGFFDAGNFDESISKYQELLELSPEWWAVDAYTKIGFMLAQQGKPEDSVRIYREVLEFNDEAELKENVHHIHLSLGIALQRMAQHEEAREHLQLAVDGYEKEVLDKPRSRPPLEQLGDTYAALASWSEAAEVFAKTLTLDPANMTNQLKASQRSRRGPVKGHRLDREGDRGNVSGIGERRPHSSASTSRWFATARVELLR